MPRIHNRPQQQRNVEVLEAIAEGQGSEQSAEL